jgi:hypothetical protein
MPFSHATRAESPEATSRAGQRNALSPNTGTIGEYFALCSRMLSPIELARMGVVRPRACQSARAAIGASSAVVIVHKGDWS